MKKMLTTLVICGFSGMNLMADGMNSRTTTIGNTTITIYRDGAPSANSNVIAIHRDGKFILVGAGLGGEDGFLKHFIADGHQPENITAILLMHGDNIGGLLNGRAASTKIEGGGYTITLPSAFFSNATLYISKALKQNWDTLRPVRTIGAPPLITRQVENAYKDRFTIFEFETEVLPGIIAVEGIGQNPSSTIFVTRDVMFIGNLSKNNSGMDDGSGVLTFIETARKAIQGDEEAKQKLIKEMGLENYQEKISFDWIERLATNTNLETRSTAILEAKRERERLERERREQQNQ